jgi:hypothetical protein
MAIGCSGGGDTTAPHFNDTSGTPGVIGNVGDPVANPGTSIEIPGTPVVGASDSAPLGTNPAYTTQPISNLITTTRIEEGGTSSLRSASDDNRVLWVAVAKRGEAPIPGSDAPPLAEGDQIDLYIVYNVFQGELNISRQWILEEAGLNYIEPSVSHPEPGTYMAIFPFVLPYGTAIDQAVFKGVVGPARTGSIVVVIGFEDFREVLFEVLDTPTLEPIHYPDANPDDLNDSKDHAKGCLPEYIYVEFYGSYITVESDHAPSNVRILTESGEFFLFEDLPEDLFQVFYSPNGENITDAWVKVGCNEGGDGSGFGEHFAADGDMEQMAMAQFAWDDDSENSDFDYNDFIGRMRISEVRNENNEMVMMFMTAKALARGSTNIADWQFNVGASFPGADEVYALVTQYHADGTQAAPQTVWQSTGGTSFPVFAPTSDAFPGAGPNDKVNVESGTFIDGDYAEVIVILNNPQAQGSYTPIPYEPELYVSYGVDGDGNPLVETIPMWSKIGDELRADGFPQAFIVPDTYAYAMEGSTLANVYPEFWSATDHDWIDWINGQPPEPAPPWWQYPPVPGSGFFDYNLYFSN